jgi:4-amino-4-deoxy-L-arabinose transferase-like glycosyltransferase
MLMDLGLPFQEALHQAQAFYQQQPIAADPVQAPLFRGEQAPLYWDVFKPRVLYPFLAALLYPIRGFYGMLDISAAAYVLSALAVYFLALEFGAAIPSFVVTLAYMAFPRTLHLARYPQTDMIAMLFSTFCILALVRVAHGGGRRWIALFALAGLLLVFTRPAFYLLVGGAFGLLVSAPKGEPAHRRDGIICLGIALVCSALYLSIALFSDSPSFLYVVEDARQIFFNTQPPAVERSVFTKLKGALHFSEDDPLGIWYAKMVLNLFFRELARGIVGVFPVVAFFGLTRLRRDRALGVLAGTALAFAFIPFLDPISLDMDRVLEFPFLPILAVGLVAAWGALQAQVTGPNRGSVGQTLKKTSPGG